MTNVDFKIEDPVRKWKREADERQAEIDAEREKKQRERERAQRRAQREANGDWDRYFHALLEIEREFLCDVVGQAIGEMIAEFRQELEKKMQVSLRIAILEQGGMSPHVRGTWTPAENYSALDIVACDGATFIAKRSGAGACPGEDWGPAGERGATGPSGPPGLRGEPGREITGWQIDRKNFSVRPILDGGRGGFGTALNLRRAVRGIPKADRGGACPSQQDERSTPRSRPAPGQIDRG